jgi:hypothetical protein
MKIKQLLFLLAVGVSWLPAADNDEYLPYSEVSEDEQVDARESDNFSVNQDAFTDNPYLGEGFSSAESNSQEDVEYDESSSDVASQDGEQYYDGLQSSPMAAPEDETEAVFNSSKIQENTFEYPNAVTNDFSENVSESEENMSSYSDVADSVQENSSQYEDSENESSSDEWASSDNEIN